MLSRLTRGLAGGDILLLHDGHAARSARSGRPVLFDVLPQLAAAARAAGLRWVTLDPVPEAVPLAAAGVAR